MARLAVAAKCAPAFGLQRLCLDSQVGVCLSEDVPDGVHVWDVAEVADVAGDAIGVLVVDACCDLRDELFSDHRATSLSSIFCKVSNPWKRCATPSSDSTMAYFCLPA